MQSRQIHDVTPRGYKNWGLFNLGGLSQNEGPTYEEFIQFERHYHSLGTEIAKGRYIQEVQQKVALMLRPPAPYKPRPETSTGFSGGFFIDKTPEPEIVTPPEDSATTDIGMKENEPAKVLLPRKEKRSRDTTRKPRGRAKGHSVQSGSAHQESGGVS